MANAAKDTLHLDEPYPTGTLTPAPAAYRCDDLARIVRRSLRKQTHLTPLDRAIRSAAEGPAWAGDDQELRIRQIALRMGAILAEQEAAASRRAPHAETVAF